MRTACGAEGRHNLELACANFVFELQQLLAKWHEEIAAWQDWVTIDWAGFGKLPTKLWGFADLFQLPQNAGIDHGSCRLCSGVCAIAESATCSEDKAAMN